jgi:hypothetical protein
MDEMQVIEDGYADDYAKEHIEVSCPSCQERVYAFELIDDGCMTCSRFDGELYRRLQALLMKQARLTRKTTMLMAEIEKKMEAAQ